MLRSLAPVSCDFPLVLGLILGAGCLPAAAKSTPECGQASWYDESAGASGGFAAAHPSLPFGTTVIVENLTNGRSTTVKVNDRGPFTGGRIIDVTRNAAEELGFVKQGVARVRVSLADDAAGAKPSCR